MLALVIFVYIISNTYCSSNITENYGHRRVFRCSGLSSSMNDFVGDTLISSNSKCSGYPKRNVSKCSRSDSFGEYSENDVGNVLNGLLLHDDLPEIHWHEFKQIHNKAYASISHEMAALNKWRENLRRVARHNRQFLAGRQSYSLDLNLFGDMDPLDYFNNVLKLLETPSFLSPGDHLHRATYRYDTTKNVPSQLDWRSRGYRPRREKQWRCGACYAFAVAHAVQAQLFRRRGRAPDLSVQQIVDCSTSEGNLGCDGGSLKAALRYAARAGLVTESRYPYKGKQGYCRVSLMAPRVRPHRWGILPVDEDAIERALANGPLPVGVNAAPVTFQLYRSGVYDDPFCLPWKLNHAMLLVGYTRQYWILLNWWGKDWGEDGYIRIRRGLNLCGVANMAMYVEV